MVVSLAPNPSSWGSSSSVLGNVLIEGAVSERVIRKLQWLIFE